MGKRLAGRAIEELVGLAPGVGLCALLAIAASGVARVEATWFGRAWLEPVALSILLGVAVRTLWRLDPGTARGVGFAGKTLLEVAVILLEATVSIQALGATGPFLLIGIVVAVLLSVTTSYAIGGLWDCPANSPRSSPAATRSVGTQP